MKKEEWKVYDNDTVIFIAISLDEAMLFAKSYAKFVEISDGEMKIVGRFGVDAVEDATLPNGDSYTWTMRRDENHRSWRKKLM